MKLKTCFRLSVLFPVVFTTLTLLALNWHAKRLHDAILINPFLILTFGIVGLVVALSILCFSRDIFFKIKAVNDWTHAVLKGDLDYQAGLEASDDEFGQLANSLSHMLREIKSAYASMQSELKGYKKQSDEFKKLAEASQMGTERLSDSISRIKSEYEMALQAERLKTLENTIRGVSHDISEAMVPILCTTELMMDNPDRLNDREEVKKSIEMIHEAVQRTRASVHMFADFFDAFPASKVPIDINNTIKQCVHLVTEITHTQTTNAHISFNTNLDQVPAIGANEQEIQDAIVNLLINAIDAMPTGGSVAITSRIQGKHVIIEIKDSGKGMPDEVQTRCIEPFFTTKNRSGAGLGLTNAYVVTRRYGGELTVNSVQGQGTKITLRFPVWQKSDSESSAHPDNSRITPADLNVLVTDDDPITCDCIAHVLAFRGYNVKTAYSADAGLSIIRSGAIHMAIIDRAMPGVSGDHMALEIKRFNKAIPVLMLTGYGDIMIKKGVVPKGVDLVLSKPVKSQELENAISRSFALSAQNVIHYGSDSKSGSGNEGKGGRI